jgi:TRAP-type uncharacterized transport system substrate-binding protein
VRPAPPKKIVISTGAAGGAYHYFGERYRDKLAQDGIEVELRPSSGAVENLRRLKTDDSVDVGFIQGGIANEPESEDLATLGSMYLEPVWVFHRGRRPLDRIDQLKGRRIAVGGGQRRPALCPAAPGRQRLRHRRPACVHRRHGRGGALKRGDVEAFFVVGAPQAPVVDALLHTDGISLLNFAQADGYVRHFPHLVKITLPRGAIDIRGDQPPRDIQLLAATANLVVKADIHPAIVTLLLKHARDIHSAGPAAGRQRLPRPRITPCRCTHGPALLRFRPAAPAALPALLAGGADRPPVRDAAAALRGGDPPLQGDPGHLQLAHARAGVSLVRRAEVSRGRDRPRPRPPQPPRRRLLARLDRIEERAAHRKLPLAFSNELYTLREHIGLVRRRLRHLAETVTHPERPIATILPRPFPPAPSPSLTMSPHLTSPPPTPPRPPHRSRRHRRRADPAHRPLPQSPHRAGFIFELAHELARRLSFFQPNMILTAEASGIAPALIVAQTLSVPMVYAKKYSPQVEAPAISRIIPRPPRATTPGW